MCIVAAAPLVAGAGAAGSAASIFSTISTIATIGSTIFSVVGAFQQSNANQQVAADNAVTAQRNQEYALARAQDARERGAIAEKQRRLKLEQDLGDTRAGFAAGGVRLGEGSALDREGDIARLGELDALTIRNNADREAFEHEIDAENFGRQEAAARRTQKNAKTSGFIQAGTSVLGGVGTLANQRARRIGK